MLERRYFSSNVELRSENGVPVISGCACRYDHLSKELDGGRGTFRERLKEGCFSNLNDPEMYLTREHDPKLIMARVRAGNLEIKSDQTGVHYRASLDLTNPACQAAYSLIRSKVCDEMSFQFVAEDPEGQEFDEEDITDEHGDVVRCTVRTLRSGVRLGEISLVSSPAYSRTSASIENNPSMGAIGGRSYEKIFPQGTTMEFRNRISNPTVNVKLNLDAELAALDREERDLLNSDMTKKDQKKADLVIQHSKRIMRAMQALPKDTRFNLETARLSGGARLQRLDDRSEREWRQILKGEARAYAQPLSVGTIDEAAFSTLYPQGAEGQYLVAPLDFSNIYFQVTSRLADEACFAPWSNTTITTEKGGILPIPVFLESENQGLDQNENQQGEEIDTSLGILPLQNYRFSSGLVPASLEWITSINETFPLASLMTRCLGLRLCRQMAYKFIRGQGRTEPLGILASVVGSGVPAVIASGAQINNGLSGGSYLQQISSVDCWNLMKCVDEGYRRRSIFVGSQTTLDNLSMLTDTAGRPLVNIRKSLNTGGDADEPQVELMGHGYAVSNSMPSSGTASANVLLFGSVDYWVIRLVKSLGIQRYWQAQGLIEAGLCAFSMVGRGDCGILANPPARPTWAALACHS